MNRFYVHNQDSKTLSYLQKEGILFVWHLYGCSASNIDNRAAWDSQSGLGGLQEKIKKSRSKIYCH